MPITPIQEGSSTLRPRARLIKTIGEELISSDKVALVELVKNSYDADADIIVIEFAGKVITEFDGKKERRKLLKEGASIQVYDDGSGMTLETIQSAWMEPATISKKIAVESADKKRRVTGEKGIGRFSSARLSSELQIITRTKEDNEVVADFSWEKFENANLYLDEVACNWKVRTPTEFTDSKHGTKLILNNLNSDWDEEKIRDLRITLQRLINPVVPVLDFLIELRLPPGFEAYTGVIEPPESLTKPNYAISGQVNGDGIAIFEYKSRKLEKPIFNALPLVDVGTDLKSGPFEFNFKVWDRDAASLKEVAKETNTKIGEIRKALDEISGISIYRNGFRVLPYGNPTLDWLRLDLRRVNNPTLRISNNQIIGFIAINLETNPAFTDQSNREGIVDSEAFDQLKEFVIAILSELEVRRYEERPRENVASQQEGLFDSLSISPVVELVRKRLPNDYEANEVVSKAEANINESIGRIQEVLSRYRRLSTLGLLIDIILHDGNNFLARIDSELHLLIKSIKINGYDNNTFKSRTENINEARKVLAQLFKRMEPFGGRKRGKPTEIVLEESIGNVFNLYKTDIERLEVLTDLPETSTLLIFDAADLQLILVNLLQNSLYWLGKVESERRIIVRVEKTENFVSIIFSDSGPGIPEEHQDFIFDPYFTTRSEGIGLGLTIVGELIAENHGNLQLISNGPLDGATFKINFQNHEKI